MTLLLDLEADTLSLNDGDPVSTWSDLSGNGYDFAQSGSSRPIYHANDDGYPSVETSASPARWMVGSNWGGGLTSWSIFIICKAELKGTILAKVGAPGWPGWMMANGVVTDYDPNGEDVLQVKYDGYNSSVFNLFCGVRTSNTEMHLFTNGSEAGSVDQSSASSSPADVSTDLVTIGSWQNVNYTVARIHCIRMYAPALDAVSRAAVEAELGARYGVEPYLGDIFVSVNPFVQRVKGVRIYP